MGCVEASDGPEDAVYLRMSRDEALVLFEWLHQHEDQDIELSHLVTDSAERQALWHVSAALEKLLAEPFREDYAVLLDAAKDRLRPSE